jgi:hypothetical protein
MLSAYSVGSSTVALNSVGSNTVALNISVHGHDMLSAYSMGSNNVALNISVHGHDMLSAYSMGSNTVALNMSCPCIEYNISVKHNKTLYYIIIVKGNMFRLLLSLLQALQELDPR